MWAVADGLCQGAANSMVSVGFGKGGCGAARKWTVLSSGQWFLGLNAQRCQGAPGSAQLWEVGKVSRNGGKKGKIASWGHCHPTLLDSCVMGTLTQKCVCKYNKIAQEASMSKGELAAVVWKWGRLRAPMDLPPESSSWLSVTKRPLGHSKKVQGPLKFCNFAKGWFSHRRNKILALGCLSFLA